MLRVFSLIAHILIIGSISVIYFHSTYVSNLKPQNTLRDLGLVPPADRLVVFLTDGYRAQSFFRENCSHVPHIRDIFLEQGIVGVSRTCAPTQSRPGHIAVFGGFYEDPSAALYDFKQNPNPFDTVFNRSGNAIGWGAWYIITIFTKLPDGGRPLKFHLYTNADFTGRCQTDAWVFNKARDFLGGNEVEPLMNATQVVFFVYLGDLDVAGHVYKPNSQKFMRVENFTESGIAEIYQLFENTFSDGRTSYLMTSDHGMTNYGSHGTGSAYEIEVPFVFWGAGVNRDAPDSGHAFAAGNEEIPLRELDQIQLAPLMSALIGLPPPLNNMAMMPVGYLNVSDEYEAQAMHINALQLLEQVQSVRQEHHRGFFSGIMRSFVRLDSDHITRYKQNHESLLRRHNYELAMNQSLEVAQLAVECLDFYHDYYRLPLLLACIATYLGWFYFLLAKQQSSSSVEKQGYNSMPVLIVCAASVLLAMLIVLQRVHWITSFYLLLPLPIWILALSERRPTTPYCLSPITQVLWMGIGSAMLMSTFYKHRIISLGYVVAVCINNRRGFIRPSPKFFFWLLLVLIMSIFPLFRPSVGYLNETMLYVTMLLTVLRPFVCNQRHEWFVWVTNASVLLMGAFCVYRRSNDQTVFYQLHIVAWLYILYAFVSIPFSKTRTPHQRVDLIVFNLATVYTLLCTSFESIFLQLLFMEYYLGLQVHNETKYDKDDVIDGEPELEPEDTKQQEPEEHLNSSYRHGFFVLLYAFFSFYSTGNNASLNSFDPNISRVFITDYNIIWISFLVGLKLFLPIIIIMTTMYAFCGYVRRYERQIIICMFLIADLASMYFLFLVQNHGSWRQVRHSISRVLIVHGTTMVLVGVTYLAKLLLTVFHMRPMPSLQWGVTVFDAPPQDNTHA